MGRPIAFFYIFCSFGALLLAAPAHGDDAKALYDKAVIHFKQGDYEAAQESFKEAYNLSGRADLLYNLALCAERLGDLQRAIAYYQVYLDERPDAPDAERVRGRMEELREQLEKPPLAVEIVPAEEGKPSGEAESSSQQGGAQVETAQEPQDEAPKADPNEGSASEPPPAEPPQIVLAEGARGKDDQRSLYIPGALLGAGGLLLAGGLVAGIAARSERDSLEQSCAPECSQSRIDKGKSIAVTADALFGLGAASAVAGGVWLLLDFKKNKRTGRVRLTTAPLRDGAAVIVQGSFP